MSAAKHTAGPWQVAGPSAKGYLIVKGASGQGVALILMDSSDEEADACLIASAPDLLAALQQINDWCCYATEEDTAARLMAMQQIGVHARAAIAKATGEGA